MQTLVDNHGRTFPYLRLSLTEACNYSCTYCLPDGYRAEGRNRFLDGDEIARLLRAFGDLGMSKLRLTGGEPSLRKDLPDIIRIAAGLPCIRQVALTTNGCRLPHLVEGWREAGLTCLNVSLDSLDPERFRSITGHDRHQEVVAGIERAFELGFTAVKVNVVLLRGTNDDELPGWLEWIRGRDVSVRFIELMRTGDNGEYFKRHHVRAATLVRQLEADGWRRKPRAHDAGPALEYEHRNYRGRIGVIAPYAPDFCLTCNRLRVTARGDLRLCLFGHFGIPLRSLLQSDADREALVKRIVGQLGLKEEGHGLHQGLYGITPQLASIGG